MTAPRFVVPGQTYLLTRRCSERRFFLRPDDQTTQLFLYCLAEAAQRYGVEVIAWVAMSNHYHAVVHDPAGVLPEFMCHFHKTAARSLNARWNRRENLWAAEQASAVRLIEPGDILDKVVYALANPVQGRLVDRALDWPGASSLAALDGRARKLERPHTFFKEGGAMPRVVRLVARVPPGWPGGAAAWATAVREAVHARELAERRERLAEGRRLVRRRSLRHLSPFSRPSTPAPRRKLRPQLACRNLARRVAELQALQVFRAAYASARALFVKGRHAIFPRGTYKFVHELGAKAAPA